MLKKDLGLCLLILVIGAVVALINPRFVSAVNLANTANLIGLFGLFSLGEGIVIITGGIDLSIGSLFALFGVIFVDLLSNHGVPPLLAVLILVAAGIAVGFLHGFLITRMRMQPFVVTLCGLLIYRGIARYYTDDGTAGFQFGESYPTLEWLTTGRSFGVPNSFTIFILVAHRHGRDAASLRLGALPLRGRPQRRGGALLGHPQFAHHPVGLRGVQRHRGLLGRVPHHVHPVDLAGLARQFLRALRHRGRGARRLLAAGRGGFHPRHRARRDPAPGVAEPRESPRDPEFAQLRRDGGRDPDRCPGRPAARRLSGPDAA